MHLLCILSIFNTLKVPRVLLLNTIVTSQIKEEKYHQLKFEFDTTFPLKIFQHLQINGINCGPQVPISFLSKVKTRMQWLCILK